MQGADASSDGNATGESVTRVAREGQGAGKRRRGGPGGAGQGWRTMDRTIDVIARDGGCTLTAGISYVDSVELLADALAKELVDQLAEDVRTDIGFSVAAAAPRRGGRGDS